MKEADINLCVVCGKPLYIGCNLNNVPEHCKEHLVFNYMKIGEGAHFDCYIERIVSTMLNR